MQQLRYIDGCGGRTAFSVQQRRLCCCRAVFDWDVLNANPVPTQGVDYLGLDPTRKLLLFSASHPDALRDLKLPLAAVQRHGAVEVRSDLIDHHLYVFSRWVGVSARLWRRGGYHLGWVVW